VLDQPEDLAWIRLEDDSAIGSARRAAADVAAKLGFSPERVSEVAIVTTELATNAVVHASAGSLLVRVRRGELEARLELIVTDAGPGMIDVEASFEDGVSTRGTLGVGLGSARRLANVFDLYSRPEVGTVMHAVLSPSAGEPAVVGRVDGLTRPITGEHVCGDAWAAKVDGDRTAIIVADGLGHGELAAAASRAAVESFLEEPWRDPVEAIERTHRRIAGTRGAAVLVLELDAGAGNVHWAGVGNVVGRVVGPDKVSNVTSQPGIVGHRLGHVRSFHADVPPGSVIALHSDGLTSKWDLSKWPGLSHRSAPLIAAVLLREAGLRQDDASVVVVRDGR
jgi:anti-sigma regulatory factor (Ser/Thr protein kinase)